MVYRLINLRDVSLKLSILTLVVYNFINSKQGIFIDNFRNQMKRFRSTVAQLIVVCC